MYLKAGLHRLRLAVSGSGVRRLFNFLFERTMVISPFVSGGDFQKFCPFPLDKYMIAYMHRFVY